MAESEAIRCLVTDGTVFYSLRLAVTPETKARVQNRDLAHPIIEGTALQIKWNTGHTQTVVPTAVRMHSRYAAVDRISSDFIVNLIYNEQLGGVFDILQETGTRTWEQMEYLPVPLPQKSPPKAEVPRATELPQKVIPATLGLLFMERIGKRNMGSALKVRRPRPRGRPRVLVSELGI